ncbi:MAG: hypothetical protein PHC34_08655, partial [Candidatus Gastranaerophilales bacterium]|nr:hypothetical protein [Candidatus Gastranaerophilales bacterium]
LAEVLITLLIVGVISSIVIPALLQDTQQAEFKTAWKKTYADLSQATTRVMMGNGGTISGLCGSTDNNDCFRNKYLEYLTYSSTCSNAAMAGNCWPANYYYLNGNSASGIAGSGVAATLNNGSLIIFNHEYDICGASGSTFCGFFLVDVNGFKKPNTFGKDLYGIYLYSNKISPWGSSGSNMLWGAHDTSENTCATTGLGCAAKYLSQ